MHTQIENLTNTYTGEEFSSYIVDNMIWHRPNYKYISFLARLKSDMSENCCSVLEMFNKVKAEPHEVNVVTGTSAKSTNKVPTRGESLRQNGITLRQCCALN